MKTLLSILLAACLLAAPGALAEAGAAPDASLLPSPEEVSALDASEALFTLWFEEGFSLSLPEGWVSYAVNAEDATKGIRYALGDGQGDHFLYIQLVPTDIGDSAALERAVEASPDCSKTGNLSFNGASFVTFIDSARNASCCATLLNSRLLTFIFTPQSDSDYMLTVSRLMATFTKL